MLRAVAVVVVDGADDAADDVKVVVGEVEGFDEDEVDDTDEAVEDVDGPDEVEVDAEVEAHALVPRVVT